MRHSKEMFFDPHENNFKLPKCDLQFPEVSCKKMKPPAGNLGTELLDGPVSKCVCGREGMYLAVNVDSDLLQSSGSDCWECNGIFAGNESKASIGVKKISITFSGQ